MIDTPVCECVVKFFLSELCVCECIPHDMYVFFVLIHNYYVIMYCKGKQMYSLNTPSYYNYIYCIVK